jgi:RHS repeat-associated protein
MGYFIEALNSPKHDYDDSIIVAPLSRSTFINKGIQRRTTNSSSRYDTTSCLTCTQVLVSYYGFRYYDPQTGRWPSRDPIGEFGSELISKGNGIVAFEAKTRSEIRELRAEIINQINWIIGMVSGGGIQTIDDYYDVLDRTEIVAIDLDYLLFLESMVTPSGALPELLREGPSLYAFLGNTVLNGIDVLGQAHGKNNLRETRPSDNPKSPEERNKQEKKQDGDIQTRLGDDAKDSPQSRKERRDQQKEKKKQEEQQAKEEQGRQDSADEAEKFGNRDQNPGASGQMAPGSGGLIVGGALLTVALILAPEITIPVLCVAQLVR